MVTKIQMFTDLRTTDTAQDDQNWSFWAIFLAQNGEDGGLNPNWDRCHSIDRSASELSDYCTVEQLLDLWVSLLLVPVTSYFCQAFPNARASSRNRSTITKAVCAF